MKQLILALFTAVLLITCTQTPTNDCDYLVNKVLTLSKENDSLKWVLAQKHVDTVLVHDTVVVISPPITVHDTIVIVKLDTVIQYDTVTVIPSVIENYSLVPDTIRVDTTEGNFNKEYLFDQQPFINLDNKGTRWGVRGYPHYIALQFDSLVYIDSIYINTYAWDRDYTHEIKAWSWGDSIAHFTTLPIKYSGHGLRVKTTQLVLEILGGKNNYTDIGELILRGRGE